MKSVVTPRTKKRVLVADDTREVAVRVMELVESFTHLEAIGPALDGDEAWTLYQQTRPDVAILDFHMPGLNGLEILTRIRQRDAGCLVVVMTSSHEAQIGERCRAAGANHFLNKSALAEILPPIFQALAAAA